VIWPESPLKELVLSYTCKLGQSTKKPYLGDYIVDKTTASR
jgi:hypothetical protein